MALGGKGLPGLSPLSTFEMDLSAPGRFAVEWDPKTRVAQIAGAVAARYSVPLASVAVRNSPTRASESITRRSVSVIERAFR